MTFTFTVVLSKIGGKLHIRSGRPTTSQHALITVMTAEKLRIFQQDSNTGLYDMKSTVLYHTPRFRYQTESAWLKPVWYNTTTSAPYLSACFSYQASDSELYDTKHCHCHCIINNAIQITVVVWFRAVLCLTLCALNHTVLHGQIRHLAKSLHGFVYS